jgi:hypothetical protein
MLAHAAAEHFDELTRIVAQWNKRAVGADSLGMMRLSAEGEQDPQKVGSHAVVIKQPRGHGRGNPQWHDGPCRRDGAAKVSGR